MKFPSSATLSWATGGWLGPTLPCQRTNQDPDLEVRVRRSDTDEPLDGVRVDVTGQSAQTTGHTGPGATYFPDIGRGTYTVRLVFPNAQDQARFVVPAARSVKVPKARRKSILILVDVVPVLTLTFCDHHFSPSRETVRIDYTIQGLSNRAVTLAIHGSAYGGNSVVYELVLDDGQKADGDHSLTWDGRANRGALAGHYVNPLHAPYRVRISCAQAPAGRTAIHDLFVYYHSIALVQGTWTPDGQPPNKAANPIGWAQYMLNELGYFAGPVDGVKGPQTSRALQRYTYASPGHYAFAVAPLQRKEHDDETNATLDGQLARGDFARRVFEDDRLPAAGEQVKAYLQHDYFFSTMPEFVAPTGHMQKDQDKLDPIQVPLEVSFLLVSRDDPDGTGEGVDVDPEAIGPVEVEWDVDDPAEDVTVLPPAVPPAAVPSRGRIYVDAALLATRDVAGRDNCPTANNAVGPVGGGRRAAAHDAGPYFAIGNMHAPWVTQHVGTQVFSTVHQNAVAQPNKLGRAGAWFRSSYIAGDNFRVRARIAFPRHANLQLAPNHQALANLTGRALTTITDAETGTFTIWRTHHIAAVVDWPRASMFAAPDFAAVQALYRQAHCELEIDDVPYFKVEKLFPTAPERTALVAGIHAQMPLANADQAAAYAGLVGAAAVGAVAAFDAGGIYPYPLPPQGALAAAQYRVLLNALVRNFKALPVLFEVARQLREKVADRRDAGAIFLRFHWHPAAFIRSSLRLVGRLVDVVWPWYATTKNSCIGLAHGTAWLENGMIAEEGSYLFAHEIGHCRFMTHHETQFAGGVSDNPLDHDTNDHNCAMSYPDGINSRAGLTWNTGDATQPRFCGKCILKLRGWNPRQGLPANS